LGTTLAVLPWIFGIFNFHNAPGFSNGHLGDRRKLFQKNHYCIYHFLLNNYTQERTEQQKLGIDIQGGDSKPILPNREQAGAACSRAVNF
jgi:hypothetical protein